MKTQPITLPQFFDVVLDLDNTLIHSPNTTECVDPDNIGNFKPVRTLTYITYLRPYLTEFLTYVMKNLRLSIWTAGDAEYARAVLANILPPDCGTPYIVFARDAVQACEAETGHHKLLAWVGHGQWLVNPIIIDDRPDVYASQPANAYLIPPFSVTDTKQAWKDNELLQLMEYLKQHALKYTPPAQTGPLRTLYPNRDN